MNEITLTDQLEIINTIAQYSIYADNNDVLSYLNIFTNDGILELYNATQKTSIAKLVGRETLLIGFNRILEQRKGVSFKIMHSIPIIDKLSEETATTRTMFIVLSPNQPNITIPMMGWYHDSWRKTSNGWKIAYRIEHPSSDKLHD